MNEQLKEMKLDNSTGNVIVIINKCDLQRSSFLPELPAELKKYPLVHTSALTGEGLKRLKETLVENVLIGKVNLSSSTSFLMCAREARYSIPFNPFNRH